MGNRLLTLGVAQIFAASMLLGCYPAENELGNVLQVGESARAHIRCAPGNATKLAYYSEGGIGSSTVWFCFTCQTHEECLKAAETYSSGVAMVAWDRTTPTEVVVGPQQLQTQWDIDPASDALCSEVQVRGHFYEFVLIDQRTCRCYFSSWAGCIPRER